MKAIGITHLKICLILCFITGTLFLVGSDCQGQEIALENSIQVIDSVAIENRNIFDLDSTKYNYWLFRLANKFHLKTRKSVIGRELLQKKGEIFSRVLADETERNLRSLSFISTAKIELDSMVDGKRVMKILTSDYWTLTGGFSITRTAGQTVWQLEVEESNFLGSGQYFSINYFFRNFDEDYAKFAYLERRLLGSRIYLDLVYDDNPEVGLRAIKIGKPLFSLNSRLKYRTTYSSYSRRIDYYSAGEVAAREHLEGNHLTLDAAYRFGSYNEKLTAGMEIEYKDIRVSQREMYIENAQVKFSTDSFYYGVTPEFEIGKYDYIKTYRINGIKGIEDISLQKSGTIRYGGVYEPDGLGKIITRVAMANVWGTHFGSNIIVTHFAWECMYDKNIPFRKMLDLSIRYYNNGLSWLTTVLKADYAEVIRYDSMSAIYIGENTGLRGYPKNYLTGEKGFILNFENRIFTGIELYSICLGLVQFFDFGQSWRRDIGYDFGRNLWSIGLGLRIGVEKVSSSKIIRADLAYAGKLKEWQLSFGLGQYVE